MMEGIEKNEYQRVFRPARMPGGKPWKRVLRNDPCAYCGRPANPLSQSRQQHACPTVKFSAATIDHVEPKRYCNDRGTSNQTAACAWCNFEKDDTRLLFFLLERQKAPHE